MNQKNNINKENFQVLCVIPYVKLVSDKELLINGVLRGAFISALKSFCDQNKIVYFIELFSSEKDIENRLVFYCEKESLSIFENENKDSLNNSGIDLSILN